MDDQLSGLVLEPLSIPAIYKRALDMLLKKPRAIVPGGLATFYGGLVTALILSALMMLDRSLSFDQKTVTQHPLYILAMLLIALVPGLYTAARFWIVSLRAYACVAVDRPYRWGLLVRGSWAMTAEFLTKIVYVFLARFVPPMVLNLFISFGVIVIIGLIDAAITMNVHHVTTRHTLAAVSHSVDSGAIVVAVIATLPIWAAWSALSSLLAPSILLENKTLPELSALFGERFANKASRAYFFRYGLVLFVVTFVAMGISAGGGFVLHMYHHYRVETLWDILVNMLITGYLIALSVVFFLDYRVRFEHFTPKDALAESAPYQDAIATP